MSLGKSLMHLRIGAMGDTSSEKVDKGTYLMNVAPEARQWYQDVL